MPKKRSPEAAPGADDTPSKALQERFGINFREARMLAGLSQPQVATLSGIDQSVISKVENGRHNATIRQMQRLASVVDRDVSILLVERHPVQKKR